MHELTRVRGQCRRKAYPEDRSICLLGLDIPSVDLLPRKEKCTRVYTIVYSCVHCCIHACTLHRSRYVLCRALMYVFLGGLTLGVPEIQERHSLSYEIVRPRELKREDCKTRSC